MYTQKQETTLTGCLGLLALAVIAQAPLSIMSGWLLAQLWEWFVVPLGVPGIGVAHAIGLGLIFSFFTSNVPQIKDGDYIKFVVETLIKSTARIALMYVMALIVVSFMPAPGV